MKIDEIKAIARQHEIKTGKSNKSELIRTIQQAEGSTPCFNSNISSVCGQVDCLWRQDCC